MRAFVVLSTVLLLAACGGGGGDGQAPETGTSACSNDGQKQFVLDNMRAWYLWNDQLPANVDLTGFATPENLLQFLTTFSPDDGSGNPIDRFSFINSAQADAQFFGEGKYEGFGFSYRAVDPSGDDLRLYRVFFDSPANRAGFARGQRILMLNGRTIADINAAEGVSAVLDTTPVEFTMRRPDSTEFTALVDKDIVTIAPVPQWRVVDRGQGVPPAGYIELASFISTADPEFDAIFGEFVNNNVTDVIIDMRYNGGGLVSTAELLGDYLGGLVAENLVFSNTEFNADRAAANNSTELFERRGNSVSLSRFVVIATRATASASELVTNGLEPHVALAIVGDRTFGKPVGQIGLEFCDKILRPTSFKLTNADGFGDYFDGLPVDCAAADDLSIAVGDDADPNMAAAMTWLDTGACPVATAPPGQFKTTVPDESPPPDYRGRPSREFANAY